MCEILTRMLILLGRSVVNLVLFPRLGVVEEFKVSKVLLCERCAFFQKPEEPFFRNEGMRDSICTKKMLEFEFQRSAIVYHFTDADEMCVIIAVWRQLALITQLMETRAVVGESFT